MKVYYDDDAGCLFVEGADAVYPARSLVVEAVSTTHYAIWHRDLTRRVVGPVPFGMLEDEAGATFGTQSGAISYLEAEFKKNPYGFLNITFVTVVNNITNITLIDLF